MGTRTAAKAKAPEKKSGLRTYNAGDVLFHENDPADSLFIIQNGQVRLYRPKGRGFVDLAILRQGEVIGEMAYFDEKSTRRSCSASALVSTQVVQISFTAFAKTMQGLNPWFKTIINTLAERLRKTNEKVKNLEHNSVGFGAGGKVSDYVFFHNSDIIKILSVVYLVIKTHADHKPDHYEIHTNKLKFYMLDVFNVSEIKYEEFMQLLTNLKMISLGNDSDGLKKILEVKDIDIFRGMVAFFNVQRTTDDDKKLVVSERCEEMLSKIILQLIKVKSVEEQVLCNVSSIINDFKAENKIMTDEDLTDAISCGLCEDVLIAEGNVLTSLVNQNKLRKSYPSIRLLNAIKKVNNSKAKNGKASY